MRLLSCSPLCYVVGAGFAGSVAARVLAENGVKVVLVERREHIGGNAYDEFDDHRVLIHRYGPHIFHTASSRIFEFLSRFTEWRHYEHRVQAKVGDQLVPVPVNRTTINLLYDLELTTEKEAEAFLDHARQADRVIENSEDVVLSRVGPDLCDLLFRGYTSKAWGRELSELAPAVAGRVPTRTNTDDRYFTDKHQAMPLHGYTVLFEKMLDHPGIEIQTGVDFLSIRDQVNCDHVVFTGRLDEWFDCRFGKLPYRSLVFEHTHLPDIDQFQPVAVVNYPGNEPFTRLTEFKHLTGQQVSGTSIVREFAQEEGDPYYPIPCKEAAELADKYRKLARGQDEVSFVGRLAEYRYYNMDQVVGSALKKADDLLLRLR